MLKNHTGNISAQKFGHKDEQYANHKPSQEDNEHVKTWVCKIAPNTSVPLWKPYKTKHKNLEIKTSNICTKRNFPEEEYKNKRVQKICCLSSEFNLSKLGRQSHLHRSDKLMVLRTSSQRGTTSLCTKKVKLRNKATATIRSA